jgi:cytochrome P450 family 4
MIFLTLLGLVALTSLALFMKWRQGRKHLYELAEKFPTVPGVPLLGNSLMVLMSHNKIVDTLYKFSFEEKFSDCGAAWLGPKFAVILVNPRDIELILGSQTHLKKSDDYRFFQPWFGNGLLISDGDTWRTHRKMIAPTFHLSVLKRFMEEFDLSSKRVISRMRKEGGKTFDCHDYMSECTVETLMETVMGVKQPTEGRNCFDYAMAVMKMCDILHTRQLTLWLRPDSLFRFSDLATKHNVLLKVILNMSNRVFKKKKASFQKKETDNKSFQKDDVTNEKIRDVPTNEKFSYGQMSGL